MRIGVGGRATPNWDPFNGSLDDFRVYNTVLSTGQIAALTTAPEPSVATSIISGLIALVCYAGRKRR